ncbi:MAG: flagellar hook-basal body complex protein FliE [bacterium]
MGPIESVNLNFPVGFSNSQGLKGEGKSFIEVLKNSLEKVNQLQLEADNAVRAFSTGEDIDIHNVMIAIEKASLALTMLVEVRNRGLEAYQEMMRMVP